MLINEDKLSGISNKYILKSVFYHLNYNRLLKLFKNNKSYQNKIGITLENYKLQSNYPEYQYANNFSNIDLMHFESHHRDHYGYSKLIKCLKFGLLIFLTMLYFIYVLVYTVLLITKDTFNDTTAQGDYKNKANIINIINRCNFILLAANIIGAIILSYYSYGEDMECCIIEINEKILIILIILYNLLFFVYEGIAIWKLVLSYQIKKDGAFWFITMDYIFIFLNLLYIILIFYFSYLLYEDIRPQLKKAKAKKNSINTNYTLFSLNDIDIENYKLSKDFINMKEKERKKFLLNNYKNMKYTNYRKHLFLFDSINYWRRRNNLERLSLDRIKNFPECFIKQYTEVEINKDENVFKLSDKLYLIKLLEKEFEKKAINKDFDSDMYDVLTNKELNHVKIVKKKKFLYIFICKLSPAELFENNNL